MSLLKKIKRKAGWIGVGLVALGFSAKAGNTNISSAAVAQRPAVVQKASQESTNAFKRKVIVSTNIVYRTNSPQTSAGANAAPKLELKSNAPAEVIALSKTNYVAAKNFILKNKSRLAREYKLLPPKAQANNKRILEPIARRIARKHGIDENVFVKYIQHESRWDPYAVGVTGDIGLTQLSHYIWNSKVVDKYNCNPFDIEANLRSSAMYLGDLRRKFGGNWAFTLTAYNEGATDIRKKLKSGLSREEIIAQNPNNYAHKVLNEKI